eukprot:6209680-Pleurochrysis_carterae.AAC.1
MRTDENLEVFCTPPNAFTASTLDLPAIPTPIDSLFLLIGPRGRPGSSSGTLAHSSKPALKYRNFRNHISATQSRSPFGDQRIEACATLKPVALLCGTSVRARVQRSSVLARAMPSSGFRRAQKEANIFEGKARATKASSLEKWGPPPPSRAPNSPF